MTVRLERGDRFLLDPRAYLKARAVLRMNLEARGAYSTLLFELWDQDEPGVIEADDCILLTLARCTAEEWERVKSQVMLAFDVDSRPGLWVQQRMVREHAEQSAKFEEIRERRSELARLGNEARWGKRDRSHRDSGSDPVEIPSGSPRDPAEIPKPSRVIAGVGVGVGLGVGEGNVNTAGVGAPAPLPGTVERFPTNRGRIFYDVSEADVLKLSGLYPAVDVRQELRNMQGWLLSHPANRKTVDGMPRFVHGWLKKEQNAARGVRVDTHHRTKADVRASSGIDTKLNGPVIGKIREAKK